MQCYCVVKNIRHKKIIVHKVYMKIAITLYGKKRNPKKLSVSQGGLPFGIFEKSILFKTLTFFVRRNTDRWILISASTC